ncbi:hypothetical protein ACSSLD_24030, partial [Escherichia coli]
NRSHWSTSKTPSYTKSVSWQHYPSIRASAQGLFMTMVNGVGAWVGSILSGMAVDYFSVDGVKDWQTIWLVFAGYALFLAVIFFFGFKYNHDPEKIKHRAVTH